MAQAQTQTRRILIVDDSRTDLTLMASALRTAGYEVSLAADGDEAYAKAVSELPDCVVLDIILPKQSGFALCRHLKQSPKTRHIPVILVSVKDTPLDRRWGVQQGAAAYLVKPFAMDDLVASVRHVL